MAFGSGIYFTEVDLHALQSYRYHGIDRSLVAKHLGQPWWNFCVHLLPLWLAPNMVTLIGLIFMLAAFFTTIYHCPDVMCSASTPHWVFALNAVVLFAYQTLDAIDGKQARRTGNSSPLGELFDHGCDAICTVLLSVTISSSMQLGPTLAFLLVLQLNVPFYLAQWEEYQTGTLDLGYIGVTEGQLLSMGFFSVSAVLGPHAWQIPFPFDRYFGFGRPFTFAQFFLTGAICITSLLAFNYFRAGFTAAKSRLLALRQLSPALGVTFFSVAWWYLSPRVMTEFPLQFLTTVGFFYAYLVGRLVLSRILLMPFSLPLLMYPAPLAFACFNAWHQQAFIAEIRMVHWFLGVGVLAYVHLAVCVCMAFRSHLNIRVLHINSPAPKQLSSKPQRR